MSSVLFYECFHFYLIIKKSDWIVYIYYVFYIISIVLFNFFVKCRLEVKDGLPASLLLDFFRVRHKQKLTSCPLTQDLKMSNCEVLGIQSDRNGHVYWIVKNNVNITNNFVLLCLNIWCKVAALTNTLWFISFLTMCDVLCNIGT